MKSRITTFYRSFVSRIKQEYWKIIRDRDSSVKRDVICKKNITIRGKGLFSEF